MAVIVLETPRLVLRHFTPDDGDALAEVLCDRENMRFYPEPFTRTDCDGWVEKCITRYRDDGYGLWATIRKADGQFIGDCGLLRQLVDGTTETEVGYHLARRFQGYGYASEAARACMRHAFTVLGRPRVISLIRPENLPSRKVAERNGMRVEKETLWAGLPHLVFAAADTGDTSVKRAE